MAERKELYAAVKLIESHCASQLKITSNGRGLSCKGCSNCDLRFLCYSRQLIDAESPDLWPDPPELEEGE